MSVSITDGPSEADLVAAKGEGDHCLIFILSTYRVIMVRFWQIILVGDEVWIFRVLVINGKGGMLQMRYNTRLRTGIVSPA